MRVAAIDIGTYSTRYVVADVRPDGTVRRVETAVRPTMLGEGITSGWLTEQGMVRTTAAVAEFCRRSQIVGAEVLHAVATCAVREAGNQGEFLQLVQQATMLPVRVLSGAEEAYYTFVGALDGCSLEWSEVAVVDVGGGSTEFIWFEEGCFCARSVPLGAVRVTEQGEDAATVKALLEPVCRLIIGRRIIGTGGTITTLAAIAQALEVYDPERVHGYELGIKEIIAIEMDLKRLSLIERRMLPGLQPERADIINAGVSIVTGVLNCADAPGLVVSDNDLLCGIVLKMAGAVERKIPIKW